MKEFISENQTRIIKSLMLFVVLLGFFIIVRILINRSDVIRDSNFITYDKEGDYLIWDTEPQNLDGVWMPQGDFNCAPISEEVLMIIFPDFNHADYILKHGTYIRIKKEKL